MEGLRCHMSKQAYYCWRSVPAQGCLLPIQKNSDKEGAGRAAHPHNHQPSCFMQHNGITASCVLPHRACGSLHHKHDVLTAEMWSM